MGYSAGQIAAQLNFDPVSTQWPSTRLLQQQRLLSGLYFIAMALFLRNARLLRNQRLCLQVQQVRDTYPESLKFSLFEDLYAGQDCITTFKLAYWEFRHVLYCKAQLHCENNPSVRYCCYSFLLFQSTCSSKEVSIIYSNFYSYLISNQNLTFMPKLKWPSYFQTASGITVSCFKS